MDRTLGRLNPVTTVRVLACIVVLLVVAGAWGQMYRLATSRESVSLLVPMFDLDNENNAPSLFSALQLLLAAILLESIAAGKRLRQAPLRWYWTALAIGFLVLAIDEGVALHERVGWPLARWLRRHGVLMPIAPGFTWIIPGVAGAVAAGLVLRGFLTRLPVRISRHFLIAGAMFAAGALGVEAIEGRWFALHGDDNYTFVLLVVLEESLEMTGVLLFIRALFRYRAEERATPAAVVRG